MVHGAAAAPAPNETDVGSVWVVQEGKVDFDPRVLVPPDDDTGRICVQEQHG